MRVYQVHTLSGEVFLIEGTEIYISGETLCLVRGNKLVAMFKNWMHAIDITETPLEA
jgi:hypothetical protein